MADVRRAGRHAFRTLADRLSCTSAARARRCSTGSIATPHGGKFLLRIEDTDRERSNRGGVAAILDGLTWLGLDWDGEPVSQFARAARHREVAEELLADAATPIAAT